MAPFNGLALTFLVLAACGTPAMVRASQPNAFASSFVYINASSHNVTNARMDAAEAQCNAQLKHSLVQQLPLPNAESHAVVHSTVERVEMCMDDELWELDDPSHADFDRIEHQCESASSKSVQFVAAGGNPSQLIGYQVRRARVCVWH